jgi:hypothetical protein
MISTESGISIDERDRNLIAKLINLRRCDGLAKLRTDNLEHPKKVRRQISSTEAGAENEI